MEINEGIKKMIEENVVAFASCDDNGNLRNIAVAFVKVKDNKIIITNNYMKTTLENIKKNNNVSLAVWEEENGFGIDGAAEYYEEGEWYDFVKSLKENEDEPCKGAIVIEVNNVRKLG